MTRKPTPTEKKLAARRADLERLEQIITEETRIGGCGLEELERELKEIQAEVAGLELRVAANARRNAAGRARSAALRGLGIRRKE